MAENDLILRPKVDSASLKSSAAAMEREYSNSGLRSARTTAQFTQQALTRAYRLASRAGASAMHSAFQVGLGGIMQTMQSMLKDIDDTIDRVEGRTGTIGGDLVNRAAAIGADAGNLFLLEQAAAQKGVSGSDLDRYMGNFADAMRDTPELGGFAQLADTQGIETAFAQYMIQYGADRDGLAAIGITGRNAQGATMLAQELQGAGGFQDLLNRYGSGQTMDDLRNWITNAQANNALQDKAAATRDFRELEQAGGTTAAQTALITETRARDQQLQFDREETLSEALKIRTSMQELQSEINKMTGALIKYVSGLVDTYKETGSIGAVMQQAIAPLIEALDRNTAATVNRAGFNTPKQALEVIKNASIELSTGGTKKGTFTPTPAQNAFWGIPQQ